jgi:hypothetical protein
MFPAFRDVLLALAMVAVAACASSIGIGNDANVDDAADGTDVDDAADGTDADEADGTDADDDGYTCPVPAVVHGQLGFGEQTETDGPMTVADVSADGVSLTTADGSLVVFGWFGPDPRRALSTGVAVTARRYDLLVMGGGVLDVIETNGRVALATVSTASDYEIDLPDLSMIGLTVVLGESCDFEMNTWCGFVERGRQYPVRLTAAPGAPEVEVGIGETVEAGPWLATLLEAIYEPRSCDDPNEDVFAHFDLTLMQEESDE